MKTIAEINARLKDINAELKALGELSTEDGLDEAQLEIVAQLDTEVTQLTEKRETLKAAQAKIQARIDQIEARELDSPIAESNKDEIVVKLPAVARGQRSRHFETPEDAFVSGKYLAALTGDHSARQFMAAQSIGTDSEGGFTVPTPLNSALVNLLEEYGVARRVCKRIVMSADTWSVPKLLGHASISYPGEAGTITDSDVTFGQIGLVATKIAGLVKMSTEVTEDSIISIMDTVVQSLAYAIAIAEDQNLFNGVSGGVNATGIKGDASVADTNVASVGGLDLTDLTACQVSLGNAVDGARNEWYMNKTLYDGPIRDLLNLAPGNTSANYAEGARPNLLGAPVNFVNVLPGATASTAGDLLAVYGDASIGLYFGDRRAVNFKTLNELYAETDQVGVQCTERIDVKVANPEVLAKVTITG